MAGEEDKPDITPEYCKGRRLIFHPKTPDEARFIQQEFFRMGIGWRSSGKKVLYCEELCATTLYVEDGALHYREKDPRRMVDGVVCDVSKLGHYVPPKTADDVYQLLLDMRAEITDLRQEIAQLRREVGPTQIEKPKQSLPRPKGLDGTG